jgi:hypothetical protein
LQKKLLLAIDIAKDNRMVNLDQVCPMHCKAAMAVALEGL